MFHFSLFLIFFSLSLTLSFPHSPSAYHRFGRQLGSPSLPNRLAVAAESLLLLLLAVAFAFARRRLCLPSPPNRFVVLFACSSSLLLGIVAFTCVAFARCRHFCLPWSLLLLAIVAFAACLSRFCRRRFCLIVVADQTPATFQLPATPTLRLPFADSAPCDRLTSTSNW